MRQMIAAITFLAIAVPLSADDNDDAARKLNGSYEVVMVLVEGKPDNSKKDDKITFVIKDGTITVTMEKKSGDGEKVKFTVDTAKKPAHLNIMDKDKLVPGIYELKDAKTGTELTIAFAKGGEGGERPKDFKGEGKGEVVLKLLRKDVK